MEGSEEEAVLPKPSNDVLRKKLEAELRATEEIARIRQSVIEKRLAVELASLGEEPPGGLRMNHHQQVEMPSPAPKPLYPTIPKLSPVHQRRGRAFRRPILLPESDVYLQQDSRDDEEEDVVNEVEDEADEDNTQPKRKPSFFKGVMRKFRRRLRSEDREC